MLLTLTATCLRPLLEGTPAGGKAAPRAKIALEDLPTFTRDELGLAGLNLSTDLLVGADRTRLERLRERADRASCACLLLIEGEGQAFGDVDDAVGKGAQARLTRVVEAARLLGCTSAAVKVIAEDSEVGMLRSATRLKPIVERAEKLDVNVLISPCKGLTFLPERVAELIKRVGGFRIGTFPDFQSACEHPDPVAYLRRLSPYAAVVSASTLQFKSAGKKGAKGEGELVHEPYELAPLVEAVESVGYDGTLAIDYRGKGDPVQGIRTSMSVLAGALVESADLGISLDDLEDELDEEDRKRPSAESDEDD